MDNIINVPFNSEEEFVVNIYDCGYSIVVIIWFSFKL